MFFSLLYGHVITLGQRGDKLKRTLDMKAIKKGKLTKKVTAVKPKCPAGYKKKL